MSSLKRSGNTPKPPRTAVLPSPLTSHAKPTRGATWIGGVSRTPSSNTWMPLFGSPEFGANVPILTAGRISLVTGLMPRRPCGVFTGWISTGALAAL